MTPRLIPAVFLFIAFGTTVYGQGVFLRLTPQYDVLQESYESPWQDYLSFSNNVSYSVGADAGYIIQPRRLAMSVRLCAGLRYQHVKMKAAIADRGLIDSGFVVNSAFEETYEFLSIPVSVELVYASRYSRIAPGASISIINNFVKRSAGESQLVNGGVEAYDIPIQSYIPAISGTLFVDIILSRSISVEVAGGYTHMLRNVLKDTEADLRLHAINIKAGLIVRLM